MLNHLDGKKDLIFLAWQFNSKILRKRRTVKMRGMKVYRGRRVNSKEGYVSEVEVIVLEQSGDEKFLPIGPLKHRVRHSPTGFSWGVSGLRSCRFG